MTSKILRGQLADALAGREPLSAEDEETFQSHMRNPPWYQLHLERTGMEPDLRAPGTDFRGDWILSRASASGPVKPQPARSKAPARLLQGKDAVYLPPGALTGFFAEPSSYNRRLLVPEIQQAEGFSATPYNDTADPPQQTVGWGFNMAFLPGFEGSLTQDAALPLLADRIRAAEKTAKAFYKDFDKLSDDRQRVLVNMAYNLGGKRLGGFKRMKQALEAGDYAAAAKEMRSSKWALQVKDRALDLANRMEGIAGQ
jgi:lysozyme